MQTTKGQILWLLKRNGRETVDHLAEELTLAQMTIRQHLSALERDGLISMREERQRKGRPHFVYSLTEKGEDTFPKRYDRLAAQVLDELGNVDATEIAELSPAERTALLFRRIADRLISLHRERLATLSLRDRVEAVAAILEPESGLVEWLATADGYEIRDYNCVYRRLAGSNAAGCAWHQRVIGYLVGVPPKRSETDERNGTCCRYVIVCNERIQRAGLRIDEEEIRSPLGRRAEERAMHGTGELS
jgi:predicted ArsR family transcriptional regulator